MKKEIKIITAGGIFFLCILAIVFGIINFCKGLFDWSLLWDIFIGTMIYIGICIIASVITYLVFKCIENKIE